MLGCGRVVVLIAALSSFSLYGVASRADAFEWPKIPAARSVKEWLRATVVRPKDVAKYGLRLDADAELGPRLVLMIHGFNSTPERTAELFAAIRGTELSCATFSYPNDHALASSAELLSAELRKLRAIAPGCRVSLVAYSMGGLVARACLENAKLDPGNVDQLVMIAPPNHGSLLAQFTCATDIWEHGICGHGGPLARGREAIADGLGEATEDLSPGSEFLQTLNTAERNPRVRYSIVLGSSGAFTEDKMVRYRKILLRTGGWIPVVKRSFEKADRLLADMDELVVGRGDGVVALKRGRLDGVPDTIVVNFDHCSVTGAADNDATRRVHAEIMRRLKSPN